MDHTQILNQLIEKYQYKTYLEVGTGNPEFNFNLIKINHKECIDPFPMNDLITYKMGSDEAFKHIKEKHKTYDLIFVDGWHMDDQVDKDLQNSLEVLNDKGTIVCHDCNPPTEEHQRVYKQQSEALGPWNGTVWKSIVKLRQKRPDLYVCVVDTDWGNGIIQKKLDSHPKVNDLPPNLELDWKTLDTRRKEVLNLISVDEFSQIFLKTPKVEEPQRISQ